MSPDPLRERGEWLVEISVYTKRQKLKKRWQTTVIWNPAYNLKTKLTLIDKETGKDIILKGSYGVKFISKLALPTEIDVSSKLAVDQTVKKVIGV